MYADRLLAQQGACRQYCARVICSVHQMMVSYTYETHCRFRHDRVHTTTHQGHYMRSYACRTAATDGPGSDDTAVACSGPRNHGTGGAQVVAAPWQMRAGAVAAERVGAALCRQGRPRSLSYEGARPRKRSAEAAAWNGDPCAEAPCPCPEPASRVPVDGARCWSLCDRHS